MTSVSLDLP